ncbi:hypothetical protein ACRS9I_24445, partial [Pseudomonas aeruginosa]
MAKATNHSCRLDAPELAEGRTARRQRHRGGHGEQRDHGGVGHGVLVLHGHAEEFAQVVVAAHAPPVDEGLRRGIDAMLLLERIRLLAARQMLVLDLVALAFEQIERLQPIGAGMAGHDHPVERGVLERRHAGLLL